MKGICTERKSLDPQEYALDGQRFLSLALVVLTQKYIFNKIP